MVRNYWKRENEILKNNLKAKRKLLEKSVSVSKYMTVIKKSPVKLNLFDYPTDSVGYFNEIYEILITKNNFKSILFDLTDIEHITIESIMYLLVLAYNVPSKRIRDFIVRLPDNDDLKSFLAQCGLGDFVDKENNFKEVNNDYVTIRKGDKLDSITIAKICDFTAKFANMDSTKFLYSIFTELMINTRQHAYPKGEMIFKNEWYLFVERKEKTIDYTFLDSGEGIPSTVKRHLWDQLDYKKMPMDFETGHDPKKEANLIHTALLGTQRSNTGLSNRGKGLPEVFGYYNDGFISNLKIISGRGVCIFDGVQKENPIKLELVDSFEGTVFSWQINIGGIKNEDKHIN